MFVLLARIIDPLVDPEQATLWMTSPRGGGDDFLANIQYLVTWVDKSLSRLRIAASVASAYALGLRGRTGIHGVIRRLAPMAALAVVGAVPTHAGVTSVFVSVFYCTFTAQGRGDSSVAVANDIFALSPLPRQLAYVFWAIVGVFSVTCIV